MPCCLKAQRGVSSDSNHKTPIRFSSEERVSHELQESRFAPTSPFSSFSPCFSFFTPNLSVTLETWSFLPTPLLIKTNSSLNGQVEPWHAYVRIKRTLCTEKSERGLKWVSKILRRLSMQVSPDESCGGWRFRAFRYNFVILNIEVIIRTAKKQRRMLCGAARPKKTSIEGLRE